VAAGKRLPSAFFRRDAALVARDLVGAVLVRERAGKITRYEITEIEAYLGVHDLASHSSKGRTARTEVMFGPAGRFYIYRIYGLHWMLNVVTGEAGEGAAVLIRGVEGISGPGRVAASLGIDKSLHGLAASRASGLWFEAAADKRRVVRRARIGVDYAGPIWAARKLRFLAVS
jgi:DNA-3-methyladenine glycosylase